MNIMQIKEKKENLQEREKEKVSNDLGLFSFFFFSLKTGAVVGFRRNTLRSVVKQPLPSKNALKSE